MVNQSLTRSWLNRARESQSTNPVTRHMREWDQKKYEAHRMRIQSAKPMVDNRTPRYDAYIHTRQRLKEMAERERNRIIQRDNRKLLENMRKIMLSGGDRVDNKNFYHKRKSFSSNTTHRQRELQKISYENKLLMKRILTKETHYNRRESIDHWKVNKGYETIISKYNHTYTYKEQKAKEQGIKFNEKISAFERQRALSDAYGSLSRSKDSVLPRLVV